jgi:hypothetical protein
VPDEDGDEVQDVVWSRHYGQPAAHNQQGERDEEHRAPAYAERERETRPVRGCNCNQSAAGRIRSIEKPSDLH